MKDNAEIISEHRKMLILSGNLSSFHMENLTNFPHIVFNELEKFELEYNFYKFNESGERQVFAGHITYNVDFKEGIEADEDELRKRAEALKFFVKSLFWEDTEVSIKRGGSEWM